MTDIESRMKLEKTNKQIRIQKERGHEDPGTNTMAENKAVTESARWDGGREGSPERMKKKGWMRTQVGKRVVGTGGKGRRGVMEGGDGGRDLNGEVEGRIRTGKEGERGLDRGEGWAEMEVGAGRRSGRRWVEGGTGRGEGAIWSAGQNWTEGGQGGSGRRRIWADLGRFGWKWRERGVIWSEEFGGWSDLIGEREGWSGGGLGRLGVKAGRRWEKAGNHRRGRLVRSEGRLGTTDGEGSAESCYRLIM